MRWLTLLVSLPPTPTRHRVGVWRKLKRMGAVALRGSAWILPDTPETTERFQWLVQEVQAVGGDATLLRVERIETMTDAQLTALFQKARAPEYEAVLHGCRALAAQLDRHRTARRGSPGQLKGRLEGLKRELDRIAAVDYLDSPAGRRAREQWESIARRLRALEARPAAGSGRRRAALPPPGSVWVTRPRPHIDRIGSAWAIKRFVDPQARFAFAEPEDAPKKGIPFDILGAEFGHHGDDCTFETLLKRFGLRDRRLRAIAEIVHEADLADGKFARTETAGVDLALRGLAAATPDDHELLERGLTLFDGLYAVLGQKG
jgi:hypothetical protein